MFDEFFYAVRFENGMYYTGLEYAQKETPESPKIEKAILYLAYWQIPKDLYLSAYLYGKNRAYKVVKVKVKKLYEVLDG